LKGDTTRLSTVDAYYQARVAQILINHDYQLPDNDPYFGYNDNQSFSKETTPVLWPALIAFISQLIDRFSPPVESVCYYIPPIIAILAIIGIFLLTTFLFNPWAGLIAALLAASMGGEFMSRSIAGNADYHIFEAFLLTSFSLLIVAATRYKRLWFLFSLLAGLIAGSYCKAWYGGGYVFLIVVAAYVLYLIIMSFKRLSPDSVTYMSLIIASPSSVLFYMILVFLTHTNIDSSVIVLGFTSMIVVLASTIIQSLTLLRRWWLFPVICLLMGIAGVFIIKFYAPKYFEATLSLNNPMLWWRTDTHTSEELPLLLSYGGDSFTLSYAWLNFTGSMFLFLLGIGVMARKTIKEISFNYLFIIVGALVMISATLAMRRFAYYLAIYISITTGYVVYSLILIVVNYFRANVRKLKWHDIVGDALLILIICSMVFVPNFTISANMSKPITGTLTPGWEQSLLWLKSNSPEPFTDNNYYNAKYNQSLAPTYSVMSWWDYGYWISYISRRVPVANPGSANRYESAIYFTSLEPEGAEKILNYVKSKYVIIDWEMVTGKFNAMPAYAGKSEPKLKEMSGLGFGVHKYMEQYNIGEFYQEVDGKVQQVGVFYPDYYRSMAVRLFNFGGKSFKAPGCPIIIYTENNNHKWITQVIDTPSYDKALEYAQSLEGKQYAIGGVDPFVSCVDLESLPEYKIVYQSGLIEMKFMRNYIMPEVRIFEYIDNK